MPSPGTIPNTDMTPLDLQGPWDMMWDDAGELPPVGNLTAVNVQADGALAMPDKASVLQARALYVDRLRLPGGYEPKEAGDMVTKGYVDQVLDNVGTMPVGTIIMWLDETKEPGAPWVPCDGKQYGSFVTPDLRSRFVKGGTAVGSSAGGSSQITVTRGMIPNHQHAVADTVWEGGGTGERTLLRDDGHTHDMYVANLCAEVSGFTNANYQKCREGGRFTQTYDAGVYMRVATHAPGQTGGAIAFTTADTVGLFGTLRSDDPAAGIPAIRTTDDTHQHSVAFDHNHGVSSEGGTDSTSMRIVPGRVYVGFYIKASE
jgi:hypothetical protein